MQTTYYIQRFEDLQFTYENHGLTPEESAEFCRIGLALLKASSLKATQTYPVEWRNRFYTETISE